MLVKCVCSNCTHSYLADDQMGDLACPRCGTVNKDAEGGGPADIPSFPEATEESLFDDLGTGPSFQTSARGFDPKAPPPMYVTRDRWLRGFVFGGLAAALMGAVFGASLGALGIAVPVVSAVLLGLAGGASCRYGFGGRTSRQTRGRAFTAALCCAVFGFSGFFAGAWTVERLTGSRAEQTRSDLDRGLRGLLQQRARTKDAGTAIVLDQRIGEVERLRRRSDPELEDYLWVQEAQFNQPLVAYAKLRATNGPVIRLGPDADPVEVPPESIPAVLGLEFVLALWLTWRGIKPR